MSESEMQAELERLQAENAQLKAMVVTDPCQHNCIEMTPCL
jgi:hypothetical protein